MELLEYHHAPPRRVTERVLAAASTTAAMALHGWIGVLWVKLFVENRGQGFPTYVVLVFALPAALCVVLSPASCTGPS